MDLLYTIDRSLFLFINQTLSNPVGDVMWPLITDYDKRWPVRILLLLTWVFLLLRGGRRGRTAALLLIPLLFVTDRLNSDVLKEIIGRARPCHEVDGVQIVQGIHLLVDCGAGKSFPSSHAVNNFALATLFSSYYPRGKWSLFGWAAIVALSRPAVGVHYPSDIAAGAIVGFLIALGIVYCWRRVEHRILFARSGADPKQT